MTYKLIEHQGKMIYGKHLLLTANNCGDIILDIEGMVFFVKKLVKKIGMKPFGEPIAHRIDTDTPFGGITVVQIIRTSTITIHTYDAPKDFYLDVFSCKDFDEAEVLNYVNSFFKPKNINHEVIYRN
ncbi:MAG: S-adenosylmethionine decarboxylase [Candidatus Heimdallarchaeota archaeon]|nr:S-adenosylmethionine decarboxylase [Candidatus Heimdallarchaeota archaeon]